MVSRQPRWSTPEPNDLTLKAIIARQDDAATVQKRQQIAEQFTLGLLGQVIRDAMLAEQLAWKLAGGLATSHGPRLRKAAMMSRGSQPARQRTWTPVCPRGA